MALAIPTIRNAEERIDAIGLLLSQCSQDELADIAFKIIEGRYSDLSDAFIDTFNDAYHALDKATAQWADRHEPEGDLYRCERVTFGMHHPDSPQFGRAA